MGKFETVAAGGGRNGNVSRQQLPLAPWPICNRGHSQPLSIIGDMFFQDVQVHCTHTIHTLHALYIIGDMLFQDVQVCMWPPCMLHTHTTLYTVVGTTNITLY
jgi:hypothetical protein